MTTYVTANSRYQEIQQGDIRAISWRKTLWGILGFVPQDAEVRYQKGMDKEVTDILVNGTRHPLETATQTLEQRGSKGLRILALALDERLNFCSPAYQAFFLKTSPITNVEPR